MPTRLQPKRFLMGVAVWVPPADLHGSFGDSPETQVDIRGTLSGIPASAVDLGHELAPARQPEGHRRADGRPARNLPGGMTDTGLDERRRSLFQREQEVQPHEVAGLRTFVVVEVG